LHARERITNAAKPQQRSAGLSSFRRNGKLAMAVPVRETPFQQTAHRL
jgi:hypothetical protein